jgi:NAD(P)-dependent dehydrogenase (short-subunit alcohol dehydrogenase family)
MDEFSLTGKTILITGASSGIGREAAILIGRAGGTVIVTGRNPERLRETYDQLAENRDTLHVTGDQPADVRHASHVTCHASRVTDLLIEAEMDQLVASLPKIDGLVHCAGIVDPLPAKFITRADIDRMFAINYAVPVTLTAKILRAKKLSGNASLLFISSIATKNPYFGGALYSSSKAAIEAYSRTLALELVAKGIRSNCILAGLVETPMIRNPSEKNMQEEALDRYRKRYPLGIGQPKDVAHAILFFMSDASKWITGTSLIMGGE